MKKDSVSGGQLLPEQALPDWLPLGAWRDYVDERRVRGKRMTERAVRLTLKKLDSLRLDGNDPREVLEQSIASGWTGIFSLKGGSNGGSKGGKLSTSDEQERRFRLSERLEHQASENSFLADEPPLRQ